MADEPIKPAETAPVAAVVAEAPAPVVAAEVAPAVVAEAAPVVAEAAPVVDAPAAVDPPADPPRRDLLKEAKVEEAPPVEGEKKDGEPVVEAKAEEKPKDPAEEKPAEVKAEEPKVEGEPVEQPTEPVKPDPVDYEFTLPEAIQMDDAQRGRFTEALDGFRADPKKGGQALIDMHHEAMAQFADRTVQAQRDSWNKTLDGWLTETMADEQVGGAGWNTTSIRGARVRDAYVSRHPVGSTGYESDMASFNHMLDSTGAGNHPAMWRFLDNLSNAVLERRSPTIVDPKPAPQTKRGMDALYTHERSPGNGRA